MQICFIRTVETGRKPVSISGLPIQQKYRKNFSGKRLGVYVPNSADMLYTAGEPAESGYSLYRDIVMHNEYKNSYQV